MNKPKFRAWDKTKEEMIEVATVEFNRLSGEVSGVQHWIGHNTLERIHGKNVILMQYTGLKDKNGVDVYVGDIVRCSSGCPHEVIFKLDHGGNVLGGMPTFYLSGLSEGYQWMDTEEIIGNIHTNPELLNEVEK